MKTSHRLTTSHATQRRSTPVALLLAALLAGCGSSVKLDDQPPVESRSGTPVGPATGGSGAGGAGQAASQSQVTTVDQSNQSDRSEASQPTQAVAQPPNPAFLYSFSQSCWNSAAAAWPVISSR